MFINEQNSIIRSTLLEDSSHGFARQIKISLWLLARTVHLLPFWISIQPAYAAVVSPIGKNTVTEITCWPGQSWHWYTSVSLTVWQSPEEHMDMHDASSSWKWEGNFEDIHQTLVAISITSQIMHARPARWASGSGKKISVGGAAINNETIYFTCSGQDDGMGSFFR